MGYRGKVEAQARARVMRARNMTLQDIAAELGVSKSSVSLWVRDVPFTPSKRRTGPQRRPHPAREAKLAQIASLNIEGLARIGSLSDSAFFAAGIALYAGEGAKTDGSVKFANTDPAMVRFFCAWLRRYFAIDERRLRVRVYLHQGLDLDAAEAH
jgi:transcriptional regulator with XRE-family HTH domain